MSGATAPSETASSSEDGSLAAASAAQPPRPAKRRLVLVAGEPKKRMANLLTLLLNNKDTPWVRAFADACGLDIADGPRLATSMAKPEARAALKAQPLFYSMDEWLTICAPSKVVLEPSKEAVMTAVIGLDKEAGAPPLEPDTLARLRAQSGLARSSLRSHPLAEGRPLGPSGELLPRGSRREAATALVPAQRRSFCCL